jgi:hypothetical protein
LYELLRNPDVLVRGRAIILGAGDGAHHSLCSGRRQNEGGAPSKGRSSTRRSTLMPYSGMEKKQAIAAAACGKDGGRIPVLHAVGFDEW